MVRTDIAETYERVVKQQNPNEPARNCLEALEDSLGMSIRGGNQSLSSCSHAGAFSCACYNGGMSEGQIENDDWPILSLRLDDPGPHTGKIISLIRSVTGATPAEAREILRTPGSELAQESRMGLRTIIWELEKLGAAFHTEQISD